MSKEELLEGLSKCNTIYDVNKLLGLDTSRSGTYLKNKINERLNPLGLNADMFTRSGICRSRYEANPSYCLYCGKKIEYERKGAKFCNSSCANSYNNIKRGKRSEETKKKISEGVRNKIQKDGYKQSEVYTYQEAIDLGLLENPYNVIPKDNFISKNTLLNTRICRSCGKIYKPFINKSGNLSHGSWCGSQECRLDILSKSGKKAIQSMKERGTWKSWQSRNITSYAEKFWKQVLDNNSISYTREFFFDKKYFLDFMIVKNGKIIDLEIDGHQHNYDDRKEHDMERDQYLKDKGIFVYRVSWNCLNNEKGSEKMKQKIDSFIEWYKEI